MVDTERATVKAEIERFLQKRLALPDTVNINNLRASVEGISSLREICRPELQRKTNAIYRNLNRYTSGRDETSK